MKAIWNKTKRMAPLTTIFLLLAAFLSLGAATTLADTKVGDVLIPGKKVVFTVDIGRDSLRALELMGITTLTTAQVGLWVPDDFDASREWNVLLVSATDNGSSVGHMNSYLEAAKAAGGWIVMAADGTTRPGGTNTDVFECNTYRYAVMQAGLRALEAQWPSARTWPVAVGGFSGGAKRSGYISAILVGKGYTLIGMWMGGCDYDGLREVLLLNDLGPQYLEVPIFLSGGDGDTVATPAEVDAVYRSMKGDGFKFVRKEMHGGGHSLYGPHVEEGLRWFKAPASLDSQGGGEGTMKVEVSPGSPMPPITPPQLTGYAFKGYFSGTGGSGTQYYSQEGSGMHFWDFAGRGTLYAHWVPITCRVTFDRRGGAGGTECVSVEYKGDLPAIETPVCDGRTFRGYFSAKDGAGVQYYDAQGKALRIWDNAGDATLYGYWTGIDEVVWSRRIENGKAIVTGATPAKGRLEIPETLDGYPVRGIEYRAFENCRDLTSVTIPNSVTRIGNYAFSGCGGLLSVTIGDGVKNIGDGAFENCGGLTSFSVDGNNGSYSALNGLLLSKDGKTVLFGVNGDVAIPDSVTYIGSYAFKGSSGLTSVTIPDSVTSIGSYAFEDCDGLTSVTIPDSVTSIGYHAFSNCGGLTSFSVDGNNGSYSSSNGLLLSKYGNTLLFGVNGDVTIPDSVTYIGSYAFSGCNGLTSVTIPNSVTSIGDDAFSGCSSLTSVTIGSGVTSIGNSAFYGCNGLTSVTIPDSVMSIGNYAFRGCSGLASVTIGNGVTSIGNSAFYGCRGLRNLIIGDGVSSLSGFSFKNYPNLTNVVIGAGVTSIGDSAFSGCSGLASVTIGNGVKSIGEWAFYDCGTLANVTIPDSVTTIGRAAFYLCKGLQSVTIPDSVKSVGPYAFAGCRSLTSVTIPDSVTSIGSEAFGGCNDLRIAYAPENLKGRIDAVLPTTTAIQYYSSNTPLSTMTFDANEGTGSVSFSVPRGATLTVPDVKRPGFTCAGWSPAVPAKVPAGDATFVAQWTVNTYHVTLDSRGGIGGTASVTATYGAAMPAITIPTRAGHRFGGYFAAGTQYYTAAGAATRTWDRTSATTLYAKWIENCAPVFETVSPTVEFEAMELGSADDFSVTTSDPDGDAVTVKWYIVEKADQNRVLAGSGNGYAFTATTAGNFRVEAVASDGIANATCQWDVKVFPADVADYDEVPGSGLVWSVTGTTLTISGNGPMPDYADADPPYQTYAGTITKIVVEEGVTSVGDNAFQDFRGVTSVSLPETLASIGIGAFADCGRLATIAIPDSVETLGEGVFSGCDDMGMLYLPQRFVPYLDDLGVPNTCSVANTDVYNFVRRLYYLCFDREPERTGCASWSKRLTSGERNGAMAAFGFCLSAEMERRNLSNAEYVEVLYRAMMGRAPDSNGKAYWVDLLDNGVSRRGVFRGFAESAEFTRICNDYGITRGNVDRSKLEQRDLNYGVTKFVARCYTKALNRNYDVKGLNSWCGKINSSSTKKATAIQVARSFLKSAEFQRRNLSNSAYVDVLYQTFLGHAPDSKGRQSWLNKLNSGVSRDTVMAGFYNSNEFTNIMASYGIR